VIHVWDGSDRRVQFHLAGDLKRQQELGDLERSTRPAQAVDISPPFAPLPGVVCKCALDLRDHFCGRTGDCSRICFDDQLCVTLLLTGHNVINNHGATSGDGLLNSGAAGFADEQVALTKQTRKLICPTQDVDLAIANHGFDRAPDSIVVSDRDGQIDVEIEKLVDQFRRVPRGRVNHIKNATPGIKHSRLSILREVGKFRAYRKSECLNFIRRDAAGTDNGRALFVRNEKVIGVTAIPDGVDRDGVSDHDNAFAAAIWTYNLPQQIRIRWEG
jgi:hypothetical protein